MLHVSCCTFVLLLNDEGRATLDTSPAPVLKSFEACSALLSTAEVQHEPSHPKEHTDLCKPMQVEQAQYFVLIGT